MMKISRSRSQRPTTAFVLALFFFSTFGFAVAEDRVSESRAEWINPDGIAGSLVICGGGELPESIAKTFLRLAGGDQAKLVIVPTAARQPEKIAEEQLTKRWTDLGATSTKVLHALNHEMANDPAFLAPLKEATGVWFGGGQQSRLAKAYQGTAFETELLNLLKRGGVVGGTSAGAAIQSRVMIASGKSEPDMQTGLDLLPGAIIDQHFSERNREPRLRLAVKQNPRCVGLGIDEGTALIVGDPRLRRSTADRGRTMRVLGQGNVTVILAASQTKPSREFRVREGNVLDLTQLRRAAEERLANFPPALPAVPHVPRGALVIIGGGGMPKDVVEKILELAGGPDAKIVALPTANPPESANKSRPPSYFLRAGAKNVTVLPARSRRIGFARSIKGFERSRLRVVRRGQAMAVRRCLRGHARHAIVSRCSEARRSDLRQFRRGFHSRRLFGPRGCRHQQPDYRRRLRTRFLLSAGHGHRPAFRPTQSLLRSASFGGNLSAIFGDRP